MHLIEMSIPRQQVLFKLNNMSEIYITHLITLFCNSHPRAAIHWMDDIYSFYPKVDKCKHNDKFPTSSEIYSAIFGSVEKDFELYLPAYIDLVNIREKMNLDINKIDVEKLKSFIKEYSLWLSIYLSEKGTITNSLVHDKLNDLLN